MRGHGGFAFILLVGLLGVPAFAQEAPAAADPRPTAEAVAPGPELGRNTLSVMMGVYTTSFWARSFSVNNVGYEPNFVIAVISGKDLLTTGWGLRVGQESGLALRFGADFSIETWVGITVHFGARLVGRVQLSPQVVLGQSVITNPIGVEVPREQAVENGDMTRLVYLGSQLSYLWESFPIMEVFYRLHHRSGALRFWGNLPDGHNANSLGFTIRY